MKSKKDPQLGPEYASLVPYGTSKCRICSLPIDQLKIVHELWFDKKIGYKNMRNYLKEHFGIGNDYTYLNKHFHRHTASDKSKLVKSSSTKKEVVEILLANEGLPLSKSEDDHKIQNAYSQLVDMTTSFVGVVKKICKEMEVQTSDSSEFTKTLKNTDPMVLLNMYVNFNKAAREQVKDINALRAPKVMVMEIIENALDNSISEVNEVIGSLFRMVQEEVTHVLRAAGAERLIDDRLFSEIFKKIAMSYKDRILLLRRESLARAATALSEMEKII